MTATHPTTDQPALYDTDYLKWIEATVEQLRHRDYAHVDWPNLIEEIEYLARRERRSLKSNLIALLLHLLKWQYQPEKRTGSRAGSIVEHRRRIRTGLKDSPSLKPYLETILPEAYADALKQAAAETMLSAETFPAECEFELSQVMHDNFLPQACNSDDRKNQPR